MKKTKGKQKSVIGTVIGHPKGFGFAVREDQGEDVYLSQFEMQRVLHGDRVKLEIKQKGRENKFNGRVIEILGRAHKHLSGVVRKYNNSIYVEPLDKRISHDVEIDKQSIKSVKEGDIVEIKINRYPDINKGLKGEVCQIFGAQTDPDMPVTMALYKHQIPHAWSQQALTAANRCPRQVTKDQISAREDLTDLDFVTIDGEIAKDFDDAIFVSKTAQSYTLFVAIADVSYYIKMGSVLEQNAFERGTSVYLPNQVVPMLPEAYSNGICSLKPNVDRLVLVCEMKLDANGAPESHRFYEAVIQSKARLTYTEVWAYLSGQQASKLQLNVRTLLDHAYQLFKCLLDIRQQRGALELDIPEAVIQLDDQHNVTLVEPSFRNDAHRLIEEFMLQANVCAAQSMLEAFDAGMFRVHERPDPERLSDLRYFLSEFSLELTGGDVPGSEDFVKVLENPQVKEEWRYIISTMMLRTQKQAHYSDQPGMHFALNYEVYSHFTSPIRRYPDLIVHRLIKSVIKKRRLSAKLIEQLPVIAEHCSVTERRAEAASREVVSYFKLVYLKDKIAEQFEGIITGVSNFGFFVELAEIMTSGLVHITSLTDDFYIYDPLKQQLIGEQTARTFKIGNSVTVKIARVDLEDKKLDLILLEAEANNQKRQQKKQRQPLNKRKKQS